ncbi:hypothetical protein RFI_08436 [Reticulomyxa filosa]|uniref:Viral A-type inclusion protein n=1 Tax=Reticulomyxa filosa TaxID=46433 RepID=X6NQW3_RETFI|nr:hypothetical protein RFI_08436 [Reticulomyxa filosa]|eukprot:ETO28695.1 hypothetical protein RFI_08436 [Reticulomyxa filosa]
MFAQVENDIVAMRQKLNFFMEKSKGDDLLIEKLQTELDSKRKIELIWGKQEHKIMEKERCIQQLQSELEAYIAEKKILQEQISNMKIKLDMSSRERFQEFERLINIHKNDQKQHEIHLLKSENEKHKEIITLHIKTIKSLQNTLNKRWCYLFIPSLVFFYFTLTAFKEKLQTLAQEQSLVKTSYLSIIHEKEEELELCKHLLEEKNCAYERSVASLNIWEKQIAEFFNAPSYN